MYKNNYLLVSKYLQLKKLKRNKFLTFNFSFFCLLRPKLRKKKNFLIIRLKKVNFTGIYSHFDSKKNQLVLLKKNICLFENQLFLKKERLEILYNQFSKIFMQTFLFSLLDKILYDNNEEDLVSDKDIRILSI